MSVVYGNSLRCYSHLELSFKLTLKGYKNYNKIIEYTFYFLKLLKEKGIQKEIYEEIKFKNKILFDYKDKSSISSFVKNMSVRM